jgi:hypothetical protein
MDQTQPLNPISTHPHEYEFFAFVVDGEVGKVFPVPADNEELIALWTSNPIIVQLAPEQKGVVMYGWKHDGEGNFTAPE